MFNAVRNTLVTAAVIVEASLSLAGAVCAQDAGADEALGIWETADGNMKFEMFVDGGQHASRLLYGALTVEGETLELRAERGTPVLGRTLVFRRVCP